MAENPITHKIITRPDPESDWVIFDRSASRVEFTSDWEVVKGAKGVKCRTWILKGGDGGVDGADILIEAGGHTRVQLVKAAEVVVDAPESGEVYCVIMDLEGNIYTNVFDGTNKQQMVWTEGMIITWVAKSEARLTEFEAPSFSDEMFTDIPEDADTFQGRSMIEYLKTVRDLRD